MSTPLRGVFAAALTPLAPDGTFDTDGMIRLLDFLAGRGCHGALILGTTGEGPSFSPAERRRIMETAIRVRETHPDFRLLAGTGTPSLSETIELTRAAFDLGYEGVVVLPPYYFRKASDDGLFAWFSEVLRRAVPSDGALLGYHIPQVSGVGLSLDLVARLKDAFPNRFVGLKDSSGDPDHARALGKRFGNRLSVFNGNDRLFSLALRNGASGCITALGNLISPDLRRLWDAFQAGKDTEAIQARLTAARAVSDRFQPAAPTLKMVLAHFFGFPSWMVRPPLRLPSTTTTQHILSAFQEALP